MKILDAMSMKVLNRRSGLSAESLEGALDRTEGKRITAAPAMGQKTILLVEDDPSTLTLCGMFLREEGFTVLTAGTGQEALRVCQQHPGPIHLLITDIVLAPSKLQLQLEKKSAQREDVNGVQLMRQVMSLRKGIKTILMSGHSDERIASLNVHKAGIPFLRKPFNIEALARMVHQALDDQPAA